LKSLTVETAMIPAAVGGAASISAPAQEEEDSARNL
jgi:hypothetical protein